MKFNYLLFSFTVLLLSCGNDDDANSETTNNLCKISNVVYYPNENFNFQYNGDKIISFSSNERIVNVSYNDQSKIEKYEITNTNSNEIVLRKEFDYDNNSLKEVRTYDFFMNELIPASKLSYDYQNNNVIRINQFDLITDEYEGKTEFEWLENNIISSSFYNVNNILECTSTYSYDTNENQFFIDFNGFYLLNLYDEDINEAMFLSQSLLLSHTNGCSSNITNFSYNFNDSNLITSIYQNDNLYLEFNYVCD